MDALGLLTQDHQKVITLFEQVEMIKDEQEFLKLFDQIKSELEVHTHVEETLIYPEFEKQEKLENMIREAYDEHKQVKTLLRELHALPGGFSLSRTCAILQPPG